MEAIFDIETNGFLNVLDKTHCLVIQEGENLLSLHGDGIRDGLNELSKASVLVGHNIICFDLPALFKTHGFKWEGKIFDTLNVSRLIFPNLMDIDFLQDRIPKRFYGKHSLEAWGYRLGILKGDFGKLNNWDEWSPEMQAYCEQDVKITKALYDMLLKKNYSERAIELEINFQKIIHNQETGGILFDTSRARSLAEKVRRDIDGLNEKLSSSLPMHIKSGGIKTPKRNNARLGRKAGVSYTSLSCVQFNPGSRQQIVSFFKRKYGWQPTIFTKSGNPSLADEVLRGLPFEESSGFANYFERTKIYGYLTKGKESWLKHVKHGRIYGSVNTNGAITGRCTHSNPNLSQVPSVRKYMGKECRELFHAGRGWMIGADASGLELRMLAHYLYKYDGGKYAKEILNGDIHSANQRAAGLETRDNAKTFIYAYLYGAGDAKLGSIVTGHKKEDENKRVGGRLRERFLTKVDGLRELVYDVKNVAKSKEYLIGLDGRRLHIRQQYRALNTLLQGAGAVVMKQANIYFWQNNPYDCQQVLSVHDEFEMVTNNKDDTVPIGQRMVKSIICAGGAFDLKIRLDGEYKIGKNWSEVH